jgi:hypothetical protein
MSHACFMVSCNRNILKKTWLNNEGVGAGIIAADGLT